MILLPLKEKIAASPCLPAGSPACWAPSDSAESTSTFAPARWAISTMRVWSALRPRRSTGTTAGTETPSSASSSRTWASRSGSICPVAGSESTKYGVAPV